MKVSHVCLCGPVTDNWSYQDNLLTKYHKKLGFDVSIITSKYVWNNSGEIVIDERDEYINENGIKTIRIDSVYNTNINSKFKKYKDLYKTIAKENPDILFVHGVQFIDLKYVTKYAKENPNVRIYVDNHADFSNSATNWLSKNILHKVIWKHFAQQIEPYVEKFYGVLPARADFLKNIYKIPERKVELLVMGADDDKVKEAKDENVIKEVREKYNIESNDFLIITGGKIDNAKKQTLDLMKAVKQIENKNVKLLVFGSVINELKNEVNCLADGNRIQYIGWVEPDESYKYFAASDLVVFPGRHSVFWEQVVGLGKPMIVKYWKGTTHVDLGGNVEFLYDDSIEEIGTKINNLVNDKLKFSNMQEVANKQGIEYFTYSKIAKKSISE
ncbi:glycosyltransferase family 4 protein [Mesobacillus sp. LC4]